MPTDIDCRSVDGFPGYKVDVCGRVWSCWRRGFNTRMTGDWKMIKGGIARGHTYVWLFDENRQRHFRYVGEIILSTFVGPRPANLEVCHENDDGTDNRLENVRWGTRRSNFADRRRNGRLVVGVRVHGARLDDERVRLMRERAAAGADYKDLATELGVSKTTAWNAINRRNWRHVT